MAWYMPLVSLRQTEPDSSSLLTALRTLDPTIGVQHWDSGPAYILKKNSPWTDAAREAAQALLDGAPAATPRLSARAAFLRSEDLLLEAVLRMLRDRLNTIHARLAPPQPPITEADWRASVLAALDQ